MTIIALPRERVFFEVGVKSSGVSSSEEPASASVSVVGVANPSPDIEFLCVEAPDVEGDLSSSPDPRSRTFNSTAACLPMIFLFFAFSPFSVFRVFFENLKVQRLLTRKNKTGSS